MDDPVRSALGELEKDLTGPKAISLDFTKKNNGKSPFRKAKREDKRLKAFFWGDSGSGKTRIALQFPNPIMIDMEAGSEIYADEFDFDIFDVTTADEASDAIDWLSTNTHDYRTLIIDPITVFWDALQKKWSDIFLNRNKGSKGYKHEFYDLQARDWMTIKSEFKEFIRKLIRLDMNVILTAREKKNYKEGGFMIPAGETFDGEKSLPYMFDIVVRLGRDADDNYFGLVLKDRTGKLPVGKFKVEKKCDVFTGIFDNKEINRKSKPIEYATQKQKDDLSKFLDEFNVADASMKKKLSEFNCTSLDTLLKTDADILIKKFKDVKDKKKQTSKK